METTSQNQKLTKPSTNSAVTTGSHTENVINALQMVAYARQASPTLGAMKYIAEKLLDFEFGDVVKVCGMLAENGREPGESAFPPLHDFLEPLRNLEAKRAISPELDKTTFVRWQCPDCHVFAYSFVVPNDHRQRRCQGIPRDQKIDENDRGTRICGALLFEVYRENNFKSRPEHHAV